MSGSWYILSYLGLLYFLHPFVSLISVYWKAPWARLGFGEMETLQSFIHPLTEHTVMESQHCDNHCSGHWEYNHEKDRQGLHPAGTHILEGEAGKYTSISISRLTSDHDEGDAGSNWGWCAWTGDAVGQEDGNARSDDQGGLLEGDDIWTQDLTIRRIQSCGDQGAESSRQREQHV